MADCSIDHRPMAAILVLLLFVGVGCRKPAEPAEQVEQAEPGLIPSDEWEWKRQFGSELLEMMVGMQQDGQGNLYVCGWVLASLREGPESAWLVKFTPDGQQLWRRELPAEDAEIFGLAVDRDGNSYLAGYTSLASGEAGLVIKYDAQGERQWRRIVSSGGDNGLRAIAVDGEGRCLAAGHTVRLAGEAGIEAVSSVLVVRYDTDGTLDQRWQFDLPGHWLTSGIAVTASGDIFVTGGVMGVAEGVGRRDGFVARLDEAGGYEWVREFDGEGNGYSVHVAATSDGRCFVAGDGFDRPAAEEGEDFWKIYVIAYDRNGQELWRRKHGADDLVDARSVVVDESGGILSVAGTGRGEVDWGSEEPDTNGKALVLTWDLSGEFLGVVSFGTKEPDAAQAMCYAADGQSYYVSGSTNGLLGDESYGGMDAFVGKLARKPQQQDTGPISQPEPARERWKEPEGR